MFKHLTLSLAALALLAACSIKDDRLDCLTPVNVHVDGFIISQENLPATKADPVVPGSYSAVGAITLAFYDAEGTEVYKTTQLKSDAGATFGDFSLALRMDSYTMVAIAHTTKDESPFTLTSPIQAAYTGAHAYETFTCTRAVDIESTSPVELDATLSRVNAMLTVVSTDTKTANATNVRMTLSAGGKSFNPTTGLATVNTGFSNTVGISTAVGAPSTSSTCLFLASDEQTLDVTIEVLDADGHVLSSKLVEDVPFRRNRKTKLTGNIYSAPAAGSFLLSTGWLDEEAVAF